MANQPSAASNSSAPSCSDSTSSPSYDVFMNHRGPDVKNTFAAHLYRRLLDHGLQVFLDKPELEEGHPITSQIEGAIHVASVHVAIFSPRYAESRWCLDELVLMLNSKATTLPVFYKVKPFQLRWTFKDGAYAKALREHEQKKTFDPQIGEEKPRYDRDTIQNWRNALSTAAEISGFELEGDEEELLQRVVQGVLKNVSKPALSVAKYPTGLEDKLQDFETKVMQRHEKKGNARVVGIVGYGGVGKTTLAKAIFNRKRSYYNESSILFDVRQTNSLNHLQSKLIQDLKHITVQIWSPHEGIEFLRRHLSSCKALIILDDVDNADQLEVLLPMKDILSPESLILITSRDKHVLRSSGVLESSIYNLKGLNTQHSKELFCSYAFFQRVPQPGFEELVDQFVKACDGLPLSLKVIGALVCQKNDLYWKGQLAELKETLPEEIHKRLRLSYDSLTRKDQEIFLDIACFFLGEDRGQAIRIWGPVGVQNLEDKCLLEVDTESRIRMHDHIRDCARSIAEEGSKIRLWNPTIDFINDLLEQQLPAITEVRGMGAMNWYRTRSVRTRAVSNSSPLYCMRNFQFILTDDKGFLKMGSPPLTCHGCSDSSLSAWIPVEGSDSSLSPWILVESRAEIGRDLKLLWGDQFQGPLQLRSLDPNGNITSKMSRCTSSKMWQIREETNFQLVKTAYLERILRRVPSPHLIWLRWDGCSASSLPPWIPIENLRVLEVRGQYLNFLWADHDSQVPLQLRELNIRAPLSEFPKSIGQLQQLEWIAINDEGSSFKSTVETLPQEFCNLRSLKYLSLRGFERMISLPDSFGKLTNLQYVDLRGASSLQMLPNSFGELCRLKHLYLGWCSNLTISNGTLGNITTLEDLELSCCHKVKELPPQIAHLRSLKNLYMQFTDLKELPCSIEKLCNLEVLQIGNDSLEMLSPSVGYLKRLKYFTVHRSPKLKCLPDSFGQLTQLTDLILEGCGIEYLPQGLLKLNNLISLAVRDCPLRELPFRTVEGETEGGLNSTSDKCMLGLTHLWVKGTKISEVVFPEGVCPSLEGLFIEECQELRRIRGLCGLSKLHTLRIDSVGLEKPWRVSKEVVVRGCVKLMSIQGLAQLTNIRELVVIGSHEIVGLPGVEHCTSLERLLVKDCPKFKIMPEFAQLRKLGSLEMSGCHEIVGLPGVEHCTSLERLLVKDCPKVKIIEGLAQLNNLQFLEISGCHEIVGLPGVEHCTSLEWLLVKDCPKFKIMPEFAQLRKLRSLEISGCHEIVGLPSVEHCTSLERLLVKDCPKVKIIEGLAQLNNLESLKIKGCHEIVGLPGVEHCKLLRKLDARDCPKLQWGEGVLQQLRIRLERNLKIDVKTYKRRKLCEEDAMQ